MHFIRRYMKICCVLYLNIFISNTGAHIKQHVILILERHMQNSRVKYNVFLVSHKCEWNGIEPRHTSKMGRITRKKTEKYKDKNNFITLEKNKKNALVLLKLRRILIIIPVMDIKNLFSKNDEY